MRLYGYLARAAERFPQRPAFVEAGRTVTYAELVEEIASFAARLQEHGFQEGDTVAIRLPNSVACAVAVFATSRLRGGILMLDPALKSGEVPRYCEESGAAILLEPEPAGGVAVVSLVPSVGARKALLPISEEDDRLLLLSSGTTGAPKVVVRSSEPARRIFLETLPFADGDRVFAALPFFHSFGFSFLLGAALASGATLYVTPFSPRETAELIERESITVFPASPLVFRLLAQTRFQVVPNFSSVRLAISAGAALLPAIANGFREKFGIAVAQSYGSTESGPAALARGLDEGASGCVGRPYAGVTIEIRSPNGGAVALGEEGDVVIVSPANGCGYLGDSEAHAGVFHQGDVMTGDIGYLDGSGQVFLVGRKKSMINVAGKKVSPTEVEECLLHHPSVAEVLVLGVAAEDGDERIKAVVVTSSPVSALQLQEFCAGHLADYKIPRHIEFAAALERGSMGKVQLPRSPA